MSVSTEEVKKFADLSRIEINDAEAEELSKEFDSILGYIDTIQSFDVLEAGAENVHLDIHNVMRDDKDPHEPNAFTADLLSQAPQKEGRFWKVKKILG
ncbi:hypothetical protein COU15_02270 [Candidatus Kaiserbacteria bacterium CG10_big_fil_rev_8_21_14_0_10_45_20]|uniref:Asp/Glu-ADT subunit C n=1 Tax=Candidatus Kaiserbacteria bacterium CG10_big_fil_rev_8_21_14_0_10_45_20 TaxID=1974607 RepID=A0A2H0UFN1_9BACT|nr:MAG: hypothetical protein COU15_02270 [Candidatus Kaiserbacteria bacterium CG10_big_fil_rev_8_21_14_0_10_45_20]